MRVPALLLALGLLLAGCGGSDAGDAAVQARESAAAEQDGKSVSDEAVAVPEALKRFRCEADPDGAWFAVGDVANASEQVTSYRVTVQVGQSGEDVAAAVVELDDVAAGKEATFTFDELPAAGSEGPCRVQVLAVPPA
ncbi:hypothetical protein ACHAAC_07940 [Aeromicrobium sp. CF4.19]|uniref:hypothetical protein n=1 Tax=Aeromicrobium sp. CF4.19 TaxID=3373082 RepID=UPI003EE6B72C